MPENVLRNIIEFKLGEPEYVRLKHSKGLKEIQNKYRIEKSYNGYWIKREEHNVTFTLHIMRHTPLPLRNFEHLIINQKDIFDNYINTTNNNVFHYKPYIQLTSVLVNDDGDGIGKYLSDYIETGFGIDDIERSFYHSTIDLTELFDEKGLYDEYDNYPEKIGIQIFEIELILFK